MHRTRALAFTKNPAPTFFAQSSAPRDFFSRIFSLCPHVEKETKQIKKIFLQKRKKGQANKSVREISRVLRSARDSTYAANCCYYYVTSRMRGSLGHIFFRQKFVQLVYFYLNEIFYLVLLLSDIYNSRVLRFFSAF